MFSSLLILVRTYYYFKGEIERPKSGDGIQMTVNDSLEQPASADGQIRES